MRSWVLAAVAALLLSACSGRLVKKQYEYEEELYLGLDGSATLNVNASVPALVALRGVNLNPSSRARFDREGIRSYFNGPGLTVTAVSSSRRYGRRFVHVSMDVADVRSLQRVAPFAWSTYRFAREGDMFAFKQLVGAAAAKPVGDVGWDGGELVAFRMHLPSRIAYHNAPSHRTERGNILEWEQTLTDRMRGTPVDIDVQMETQSILARTLLLFGTTIVAAVATLAAVIWWVARRGQPLPPPAAT
ncbi:MAG TPA: hypothetical protein VN654_16990 [Vicinamibacterales bacterium]|jgi:hypothetical protein|nr:hypothetical protein [Vicinamibacterales bacterium]